VLEELQKVKYRMKASAAQNISSMGELGFAPIKKKTPR
jgi:hypothetical protein